MANDVGKRLILNVCSKLIASVATTQKNISKFIYERIEYTQCDLGGFEIVMISKLIIGPLEMLVPRILER